MSGSYYYPQTPLPEGGDGQYRQFHESFFSENPTARGQIYSGKSYCPEGAPVKGSLDGYKSVARPRTAYVAYDSGQRAPVPLYSNYPPRISYDHTQSWGYRNSLMTEPLSVARPLSGTYMAIEAGNTYSKSLGGIQWMDEEPRSLGSVVGLNNVYTGEKQVQCSYPYSSRATRASYGDFHLVGEKFWRDPYTAGTYSTGTYGRSVYR